MWDIFTAFLSASFWGSLMVLLALLINFLFKNRLSQRWHYAIWIIVLFRFMLPVAWEITIAQGSIPAYMVKQAEAEPIVYPDTPLIDQTYGDGMKENSMASDKPIHTGEKPAVNKSSLFNIASLPTTEKAAILWLLIALFIFAYKLAGYLGFMRAVLRHSVLPAEYMKDLFHQEYKRLSIGQPITLIQSKMVDAPFTTGLFKPKIILPEKNYPPRQLKIILDHEFMHIKKKHLPIKFLYELAKSLHWFNPFLYFAARKSSLYCESSCDEAVLKNSAAEERKEYGRVLLEVIEENIAPFVRTRIGLSMGKPHWNLKWRIYHILHGSVRKSHKIVTALVMISVVLLSACSTVRFQMDSEIENALPEIHMVLDKPSDPPRKTNILISGADTIQSTDIIMVCNYDLLTDQITLLSIPRDTLIHPSEDTMDLIQQQYPHYVPDTMKLGELTKYSGSAAAADCLAMEVKNLLDIEIDYYVRMDMDGFTQIIDAIGGVEIDLPMDFQYADPVQNLTIDLKAGNQILKGDEALHYIRFRNTYRNGDLDRIAAQQNFAQHLFEKVCSDALFSADSIDLAIELMGYTETDINLKDLIGYLPYVAAIDKNSLQTLTLYGEGAYIENISYFIPEDEANRYLVSGIFK